MRRSRPLLLIPLLLFTPMLFAAGGPTANSARSASSRSHSAKAKPAARAPKSKKACATCARDSHGRIKRSPAAKRSFQASHPCPSTGKTAGGCKGYVIDHVKPLACGGADAPSNMQWQTTAGAKAKDKTGRAGCGTK